jgi:uncharacterized protein (TIGR03083 family)
MEKSQIWSTVHSERKALAADLRLLGPDQWAVASLCAQWTVRDVLAHMTATGKMTPPRFFAKLAGAGFSFDRVQDAGVAAERGTAPAGTLAGFEEIQDSVSHPPGPADTMLGETIIHAEDIRRPLGIPHEYSREALVRLADFFKASNLLIGTKRRISGLSLRATDADWQHGTGPEVSGSILALVMAMTGRKQALDDLTGEGVGMLRARPERN